MTIIYAVNVHSGGGKVLLEALLESTGTASYCLFSDTRLRLTKPLPDGVNNIQVKPSILSRIFAEVLLRRKANEARQILCFGNLPPLFKVRAKVSIFFQNVILLRGQSHFKFPLKVRLKHAVERLWLRWGMRKVDTVYVQSEVVRRAFLNEFPNANVVIAPFVERFLPTNLPKKLEFDFIYVSSGDCHKNHVRLLKAWEILGAEGVYPSLVLTLADTDTKLLDYVGQLNKRGLKIYNRSNLSRAEVQDLYLSSRALIYPSLAESFGLPLIEAQQLGLPIVASELDYVRELVSPAQSFDPHSEKSIARAVRRFLGDGVNDIHTKLISASEFLNLLNF